MAGWYIRRGEKVVGPVDLAKLKELSAAGRVVPTDLLAKDVAGPWTEAGKTTLFAQDKSQPLPVPVNPQATAPPAVTVEQPDADPMQSKSGTGKAVVRGSASVASAIARGFAATGGAVSRSLATRAQRKHELKLAKIHAEALAASRTPQVRQQAAKPVTPTAITFAPQTVQQTVVKVINKQGGGCGCSGCFVIALLIVVALVLSSLFADSASSRRSSNRPSNPAPTAPAASTNERWTGSNTPAWVRRLNPKVQTAFTGIMSDSSPLFTGIICDGTSTTFYVNRSEWKQLNRFQATNNLTLAVLLPHTDATVIEYVDDRTGEILASFTPTTSTGSITLVHP